MIFFAKIHFEIPIFSISGSMQILLWRRQQEFRSSSGRWKPHIEIITFKRKIWSSEFNEGIGVVFSYFLWNRCRIDWNKAVMCLHPTKTSPLLFSYNQTLFFAFKCFIW